MWYKSKFEEEGQKTIQRYKKNLAKISTGRANPKILDDIKVNYYGTLMPVDQIATISIPEARQLLIKPYDKSICKELIKVINESPLGLTAVNEGNKIRISFPTITTERRKELVKLLSHFTEQARVEIRRIRHHILKKVKSEEVSEDQEKRAEKEIQKLTDEYNLKIKKIIKSKEKDLMTI